jgi:hypothetical protein
MRNLRKLAIVSFVVGALLAGREVAAADSPVGTWERVGDAPKGRNFTMTIEKWGKGGCKLTYRMVGQPMVMTLESKLDGSDAPFIANGQPIGLTWGLKRVDGHHATNVFKINGKQFGTATATFSDDFSKMTIEDDVQRDTQVGPPRGKTTEVWVRK